MTPNAVGRVALRVAARLILATSLAACASADPASPESSPQTSSACTQVDAPMLDIPSANDTEPRMRIPQLPGWERSTELDNELTRFTLANPALVAGEPLQNAVVVNVLPGPPDVEADTAFDQLRASMMNDSRLSDFSTTAGTVCGLPAETLTHPGTDVGLGSGSVPPGRHVRALHVFTKTSGHVYLITVTAGTAPDAPQFTRDAETILTGFQVLPPATA